MVVPRGTFLWAFGLLWAFVGPGSPESLGPMCPNNTENGVDTCTQNSDCSKYPEHPICFFKVEDEKKGVCCGKPKGYFNAIFAHLISEPAALVPLELFSPVREEVCSVEKPCSGYDEECRISVENDWNHYGYKMELRDASKIKWHCYKKPKQWTLQLCNENADCPAQNCHNMGKTLDFRMEKIWEAENVTQYSPVFFGRKDKRMHSVELVMEREDEKWDVWRMEAGPDLYYWHKIAGKVLRHCFFQFKLPKFTEPPQNYTRIRAANLSCQNLIKENVQEDLEAVNGTFYFRKRIIDYNGLCGHPGLDCPDCFINGKLYNCTEDKDCYKIGDKEWVIRNEMSYCSEVTYNKRKLCKRVSRTCPLDSSTPMGILPQHENGEYACRMDSDCEYLYTTANDNYKKFESTAWGKEYTPHCYYGRCCARELLCPPEAESRYGWPIDKRRGMSQKPCDLDSDCTHFPKLVGKCVDTGQMQERIKQRKQDYLGETFSIPTKTYKMCCYSQNDQCLLGGRPVQVELEKEYCETHSECNGNLPAWQWLNHCQGNSTTGKSCCRETRSEAMCPCGYIPFREEPECENVTPESDFSGNCSKPNGMCYRGHCCPKLKINEKTQEAIHSTKNYETEVRCDPKIPLPKEYRFAFCDEYLNKIIVMGNQTWNGEELEWIRKRCRINDDCRNTHMVCVHKIYNLRYCVVPPKIISRTNQDFLSTLSIISITCFLATTVICFFLPGIVYP